MLVVMTVKAQQFPIAAIRRVVVVVVIAMMDGELAQVGAREFPRTPTADPWIDLQRLLTIALGAPIGRVARFCNDAVQPARIACRHARRYLAGTGVFGALNGVAGTPGFLDCFGFFFSLLLRN